jgi:hypothetical protein
MDGHSTGSAMASPGRMLHGCRIRLIGDSNTRSSATQSGYREPGDPKKEMTKQRIQRGHIKTIKVLAMDNHMTAFWLPESDSLKLPLAADKILNAYRA